VSQRLFFTGVARVTLAAVLVMLIPTLATAQTSRVPPAPIFYHWPDPAFEPGRQCNGSYTSGDLDRLLRRARIAQQLPGTSAVTIDPDGRCISVVVDGVGTGRLVELLLRGVAVPRRAVLLLLKERPSLQEG
jgi:hypothetical protein